MHFKRPDSKVFNISEAYSTTKCRQTLCDNCNNRNDCSGKDAYYCNHMKTLLNVQFGVNTPTLSKNKILHSMGVANFLYSYAISHNWDEETAENLYVTGLLHDIGYLNNSTGKNHAEKGAAILERNNYAPKYCDIIRNHGKIPDKISQKQRLLWLADLCIDNTGEFIGYEARYASICERYDKNDTRLINIQAVINDLRHHYPEYK